MEKNKRIFTEFISVYKQNPCLWDPKHPNYKSQVAKQDAYEQLLKVMKKFDPTNNDNTLETVKKKINSMRASFRRDYRKVRESSNTYKPNLWYYDQLLFVKNYCSKDDTKIEEEPTEMSINDTEFTYLEVADSPNIQEEEMYETNEIEEHLDDSSYYGQSEPQITEIQIEDPKSNKEEKLLEKDDECSTFGKHIAFELQLMSERQRIIAKKLLSDIAFYGRLERLTEYTEITSTKKPET